MSQVDQPVIVEHHDVVYPRPTRAAAARLDVTVDVAARQLPMISPSISDRYVDSTWCGLAAGRCAHGGNLLVPGRRECLVKRYLHGEIAEESVAKQAELVMRSGGLLEYSEHRSHAGRDACALFAISVAGDVINSPYGRQCCQPQNCPQLARWLYALAAVPGDLAATERLAQVADVHQ